MQLAPAKITDFDYLVARFVLVPDQWMNKCGIFKKLQHSQNIRARQLN